MYRDIKNDVQLEEFEREVIRIRKSKKNRQHNGQKTKDKRTNNEACLKHKLNISNFENP
jgi:hypothetical protein